MADRGYAVTRGLPELNRCLSTIAEDFEGDGFDPAAREAEGVILQAARPITPYRTGALLGSLYGATHGPAQVASDLRYAPIVHARRPFLATAAKATQGRWLGAYGRQAQQIIDRAVVTSGAASVT